MCVHATVRACLLDCLSYRQHSPDLASNESRRRPESSALGGQRREPAGGQKGGIGRIRRACICLGDSCNALFVLGMSVRAPECGVHGREVLQRALGLLSCSLACRNTLAESQTCCFFELLSESPMNSGVCRRDRLAIKSSQSSFSYLG